MKTVSIPCSLESKMKPRDNVYITTAFRISYCCSLSTNDSGFRSFFFLTQTGLHYENFRSSPHCKYHMRTKTGSPVFSQKKIDFPRALDPRRWPKGSWLWERYLPSFELPRIISFVTGVRISSWIHRQPKFASLQTAVENLNAL